MDSVVLRTIGVALCGVLVLSCGDPDSRRDLGPDWMKKSKLAGLGVYSGMADKVLEKHLDDLVDQHVDVVIADSSLSDYKSDAQFEEEMKLVERVNKAAHARGLRVVWYLTTLEIQTVGGVKLPNSMAKDHPDWVQVGLKPEGLTATPPVYQEIDNVFYGNKEDWVLPDDESAWMCPRSPYLDYFLTRVKRIVKTGADGIWADVPLFMDTGAKWACRCKHHKAHFKSLTGKDLPTKPDWKSPTWRRWIKYRHEDLNEFLVKIKDAAREEEPSFEVVIEVFTVDYNDAMDKGLDGQFMGNVEGLAKAWEIDSVSNGRGMLNATHNDWMGKVALTKFAKGVDKGRPTWVFNYGHTEWDAAMVMAIAYSAQTNPYETKTPDMATSVGAEFRKRMFSWADNHIDQIYDSSSAARVGVLYSSHSRDYTDHKYGFAMFNSLKAPMVTVTDPKTKEKKQAPDPEWWSDEPRDSVETLEYLAEYRGYVKALAHLHVPFNIEGLQHLQQSDIQRYDTLIAPNLSSVSDEQLQLLKDYVNDGGNLILTGPTPTANTATGDPRTKLGLAGLLGFDVSSIPGVDTITPRQYGKGTVTHIASLLGRRYLRSNSSVALDQIETVVKRTTSMSISTDAEKAVYVDLYHYVPTAEADKEAKEEMVLHLVNLVGYDGKATAPTATPQKPKVTLELPANKKVTRVWSSSPDVGANDTDLTFTNDTPGQVAFDAPVDYYTIVRVALADAPNVGKLSVDLKWPPSGKTPDLSVLVHVRGAGINDARTRAASWGTSSVVFDALPVGAKRVEIVTVDGSFEGVGHLFRSVDVASDKDAKAEGTLGVCTAGPKTLTAYTGDTIFLLNDGGGDIQVDAGAGTTTLAPGKAVGMKVSGAGNKSYTLGSLSGTVTASAPPFSLRSVKVAKTSHSKGYAGHSVIFTGTGFGPTKGRVTWGKEACTVTHWSPSKVTAYLPHNAAPGTKDLVVHNGGHTSDALSFEVIPPGITPTAAMSGIFTFVRDHMRHSTGGVHTNYIDTVDPPDAAAVYPYGHHQTAEHMGLILWTASGMLDHKTYEESFQFITKKMMSPLRDVVNWAIHKQTGEPMLQPDDETKQPVASNAPLDDFRVLKGFIGGWMQWKDERYLNAALRLGDGLRRTSLSRADETKEYPGGIVAYAYNWPEHDGMGKTDVAVIPIDYADLWTMKWLSQYDERWIPPLQACTKMLKDSQNPTSKFFYNAYIPTPDAGEPEKWTGDFEYRGDPRKHSLKLIQSIWIAIHLARVGERTEAVAFMDKLMAFYTKSCTEKFCEKFPCAQAPDHPMYRNCGKVTCRIPEYLTPEGTEYNYCVDGPDEKSKGTIFVHTISEGEARIYSQVVRLAHYLGDKKYTDFAYKLAKDHIETDIIDQTWITSTPTVTALCAKEKKNPQTLLGAIGKTASKDCDSRAWDNLEALIGLLIQQDSPVISPVFSK